MITVSSYYDNRIARARTIISGTESGNTPRDTTEKVRKYIDSVVAVKYRLVNGVDSLEIQIIDAEFIDNRKPRFEMKY